MNALPVLAVTVKQAEQITGFGKTAIYDAINKGQLPAARNGRNLIIRIAALEAWIKSLEDNAAS